MQIDDLELRRVRDLYNNNKFYTDDGEVGLDGFAPSDVPETSLLKYHSADVNDDGKISIKEYMRCYYLFNNGGKYTNSQESIDGFDVVVKNENTVYLGNSYTGKGTVLNSASASDGVAD